MGYKRNMEYRNNIVFKGNLPRTRQPIYKKWWFYVILFVAVLVVFSSRGGDATTSNPLLSSNVLTISEDDYKESATTVSYDRLMENPSQYVGEVIKVTVKVYQIMIGDALAGTGYMGYAETGQGYNEEDWCAYYTIPVGSRQIVESDMVTFYGTFTGLSLMTKALDAIIEDVPVPIIKVKYYEID